MHQLVYLMSERNYNIRILTGARFAPSCISSDFEMLQRFGGRVWGDPI